MSAYVTLSCRECLIIHICFMSFGRAAYTTCLVFLFGCVSGGVNVNETLLLQCDWRHSASLTTAQLCTSLSMNCSKALTFGFCSTLCMCVFKCVHLHMCVQVPVSVANIANHT